MRRYNIKTARYRSFSGYEEARRHIDEVHYDVVIKTSGLVGLFRVHFSVLDLEVSYATCPGSSIP